MLILGKFSFDLLAIKFWLLFANKPNFYLRIYYSLISHLCPKCWPSLGPAHRWNSETHLAHIN